MREKRNKSRNDSSSVLKKLPQIHLRHELRHLIGKGHLWMKRRQIGSINI